jgi:hypothetical protein
MKCTSVGAFITCSNKLSGLIVTKSQIMWLLEPTMAISDLKAYRNYLGLNKMTSHINLKITSEDIISFNFFLNLLVEIAIIF